MIENEVNAAPIYARHLPIRVLTRAAGRYIVEAEFTVEHLNAANAVHGGMISTLLKFAHNSAAAEATQSTASGCGITLSLTVSFVRPCQPGRVQCECVVSGGGARNRFVDGRIFDEGDSPVATGTATIRVIDLPA